MKRQRLQAIVTHIRPHLEELLAIYCLLNDHFADVVKGIYSYVRFTKVLFWDELPEGTTREEWEEKGYFFIGRWGGKRDEHATLSEPRKMGQSAVTLVVNELGIAADPKMYQLIKWTSSRDLKLGDSMFELPAVLKMMNDFSWSPDVIWPWVVMAFEALYTRGADHFKAVSPLAATSWNDIVNEWLMTRFGDGLSESEKKIASSGAANAKLMWLRSVPSVKGILDFTDRVSVAGKRNPFEVHAVAEAVYQRFGSALFADWAFKALDVIYQQARDFQEVAARDYKAAKKIPIEINGRKVMAVIGQSDSLSFSRYARSSFGTQAEFHRYAAVVIVRNGNGNVSIFTDLSMKLDLAPVVEQLRIAELRLKGKEIPTDKALLRGEAAIPDCEEWYFFANGRMILDGSTTKTRPPSGLSLATITGIAFAGLGVKGFGLPAPSVTVPQQLISVSATASA